MKNQTLYNDSARAADRVSSYRDATMMMTTHQRAKAVLASANSLTFDGLEATHRLSQYIPMPDGSRGSGMDYSSHQPPEKA